MGALEVEHAQRKTNRPGYQYEAGDGGDCTDQSPKPCPDTHRDANDVGPGHELAKA
jgi:hypothetical protein